MHQFSEVYGNALLLRHLRQAVISQKVSHAYLLIGSKGGGKRMIADAFATTLECETGGTQACGHCSSWSAFASGNHPDVVYVRPTKKTLGVDDIREQILEDVSLKQYRYRYKIYIVEQADTMTVQAQNALLKTLEEPPGYAVFLLLAQQEDAFLPTVLSRTVTLRLRPLPDTLVAAYLRQEKGLQEADAAVYAAYAQGSIGTALMLLEDTGFRQMREDILQKLAALPRLGAGEVFLWAKELEQYKEDLRFLDVMQLWYRDLLLAKRLHSDEYLIQKDKKLEIFRCAVEPEAELARKAAVIQRARVQLARNANFRLTMEVMLMELKENQVI